MQTWRQCSNYVISSSIHSCWRRYYSQNWQESR